MSHDYNVVRLRLSHRTNNLHSFWAGVFEAIGAERIRQLDKWRIQRLPHSRTSLADRERARDLAIRVADRNAEDGTLTWQDILREEVFEAWAEDDLEKRETELIQSMAVILCELEQIYEEKIAGTTCALPKRLLVGIEEGKFDGHLTSEVFPRDLTSESSGSTLNS